MNCTRNFDKINMLIRAESMFESFESDIHLYKLIPIGDADPALLLKKGMNANRALQKSIQQNGTTFL